MKTYTTLMIALMMSLFGAGEACSQIATFNNIWLEHNVVNNGQKCLAIHLNLAVLGMKGRTLTCSAYVDCPKGTPHQDINNRYHTPNGQVAASATGNCTSHVSVLGNFVIYLPNTEIHPKIGTNDYYIHVEAWNGNIHLASSDYVSFSMTGVGSSGSDNSGNGGKAGSPTKICPTCGGSGRMVCTYCNGLGNKPYVGLCVTCGGSGRMMCLMCGGTGVVDY